MATASAAGSDSRPRYAMGPGTFHYASMKISRPHDEPYYFDIDALEEWLSSHGINETRVRSDGSPEVGATLLALAAIFGKYALAQELLARGADPNIVCGITPLHWFVHHLQFDMVSLLIRHGADVNIVCANGATALDHLVAQAEDVTNERSFMIAHLCMIRHLLRHGATLRETSLRAGPAETERLLDAIRSAGGWKRYIIEPRIELLLLRSLCIRGRAIAKSRLERGHGLPPPPQPESLKKKRAVQRTFSLASTTLPKEIFWHILRFWRSKRDGMYGVNPFDLHPDPNDFTGPSLYYESEEALSYES